VLTSDLLRFLGGVVAAALVMGLAVHYADAFLAQILSGGGTVLLLRIILDIFLGGVVFFLAGFLLQLDELLNVFRYGRSMLRARVSGF
jgi:hypothetical protein